MVSVSAAVALLPGVTQGTEGGDVPVSDFLPLNLLECVCKGMYAIIFFFFRFLCGISLFFKCCVREYFYIYVVVGFYVPFRLSSLKNVPVFPFFYLLLI